MQEEVWKTMIYNGIEYENYTVSTYGRIMNKKTGNVLKCQIHTTGYYNINIKPNGRKDSGVVIRLHRAIAQTFIENLENKEQVNHIDGNKLNNCIKNLEWNTPSENISHAYANKLANPKRGTDNCKSKLSLENIAYIRKNYIPKDKNFGGRSLGKKFNVSHTTISDVINNKTYKMEV